MFILLWYSAIVFLAICCAYIQFIGDIILHEIVPNEFLQRTSMFYPEDIYNELHFFDTMIALPEEAKKPMPTWSKETFMADMRHCVFKQHYWIMMFARVPFETLKFFILIFKTIICYIILLSNIPLHYLIDYSITLATVQELLNDTLPAFPLFNLWVQTIFIAILTIWARSVGPRFRPDQLSQVTWKDLLILLGGLLGIVIFLVIFI